jgi:hypothetical protein
MKELLAPGTEFGIGEYGLRLTLRSPDSTFAEIADEIADNVFFVTGYSLSKKSEHYATVLEIGGRRYTYPIPQKIMFPDLRVLKEREDLCDSVLAQEWNADGILQAQLRLWRSARQGEIRLEIVLLFQILELMQQRGTLDDEVYQEAKNLRDLFSHQHGKPGKAVKRFCEKKLGLNRLCFPRPTDSKHETSLLTQQASLLRDTAHQVIVSGLTRTEHVATANGCRRNTETRYSRLSGGIYEFKIKGMGPYADRVGRWLPKTIAVEVVGQELHFKLHAGQNEGVLNAEAAVERELDRIGFLTGCYGSAEFICELTPVGTRSPYSGELGSATKPSPKYIAVQERKDFLLSVLTAKNDVLRSKLRLWRWANEHSRVNRLRPILLYQIIELSDTFELREGESKRKPYKDHKHNPDPFTEAKFLRHLAIHQGPLTAAQLKKYCQRWGLSTLEFPRPDNPKLLELQSRRLPIMEKLALESIMESASTIGPAFSKAVSSAETSMAIACKNAFLLLCDCKTSLISPKKNPTAAPSMVKNAEIARVLTHDGGWEQLDHGRID